MRPLLEIRNVEQSFRVGFWMKQTEVLKGIDLTVPERSIFGFLGANGAGKTTLIQLIVGLRRPRSGTLRLGGMDVRHREARARIGYLPERPYFHDHLTGESLLQYFGALSGLSGAPLRARIDQVLEQVNLREAARLELKRYSKGMLQRIGLAQAILHDPEFLVLDEPMSGLDPLGRKEIRELMLHLAAEGKTLFFSTHVIPDVEAICDQVALLSRGRIATAGPVSGFLQGRDARTEIIVNGLPVAGIAGAPGIAGARELPDGVRVIAEPGADLNAVLSGLIAKGGKVVSVVPLRPSLEELLGEVGRT